MFSLEKSPCSHFILLFDRYLDCSSYKLFDFMAYSFLDCHSTSFYSSPVSFDICCLVDELQTRQITE